MTIAPSANRPRGFAFPANYAGFDAFVTKSFESAPICTMQNSEVKIRSVSYPSQGQRLTKVPDSDGGLFMSYDLFFCSSRQHMNLRQRFIDYFRARSNFIVEEQESGDVQAFYENETTGVYFTIDYNVRSSEEDEQLELPVGYFDSGVTFNLNYNRPTFFAYEAMQHVEEFAGDFELLVVDPQNHETENGTLPKPCVADETIETWVKSNTWAVGILRERGAKQPYLPLEDSLNVWRYLKARRQYQESLNEDIFVPTYFLFTKPDNDRVLRTIVWGGGIAQVFPPADYVLVMKGTAPNDIREKGMIRYEEVMKQVAEYLDPVDGPIPGLRVLKPSATESVADLFDKLQLESLDGFEAVPFDGFVDVAP
jgi:hypothetical protein